MKHQKKLFVMLFAAVLMLSAAVILGCNGGKQETAPETKQEAESDESGSPAVDITGQFSVGYGVREIMPDDVVRVSNYGTVRWSEGFYSRLYTRCIAITDAAGETVLLFAWDCPATNESVAEKIWSRIQDAYGIPKERVHITATHNHGAVDLTCGTPTNTRYVQKMINKFVEAAGDALADRRPATMKVGSTVVEGMNFVRHYYTEFGATRGDNYGDSKIYPGAMVAHTADPDRTFQAIRFVREGAKDVLLTAWRAHNSLNCSSTSTVITGGFTEVFCRHTEEALDCYCAYYQCDAGRVNPNSRIEETVESYGKMEQEAFGKRLSEYMVELYDKMTEVETGNLKFLNHTYTGQVNHSQDYLISDAQKINVLWDAGSITASEGMTMANELDEARGLTYAEGIHSVYHARYIISKASAGATRDLELSALAIGDHVAMTFDPYEMFDTTGTFIRTNSPYDFTIVCSYTDGAIAYIPSEEAYDYGCYEADTCYFVKGTAEDLGNTFIDMLKRLKAQ